ncbi:MAG TPA: hypothetical protein VMP03_15340 [Methylomirabilota bacterium]|nr:hypothetical protein [Methylomirabilota bacterium]
MTSVRHAARIGLVLSGLLAAVQAEAVTAGEVVENARKAEELSDAGNPVQALAAIEAAFNSLWDKAPLGFSEALFVAAKPQGFGIYDMRPSAVFDPGEDMLVYAEPFGYGYRREGDTFQIAFDADFELRNTGGQILHAQSDFAELDMQSRRRNKEFQIFITYNFKGLKPGDYILSTTLRDRNSPKTGSFDLPFTVAAE